MTNNFFVTCELLEEWIQIQIQHNFSLMTAFVFYLITLFGSDYRNSGKYWETLQNDSIGRMAIEPWSTARMTEVTGTQGIKCQLYQCRTL